jgi:hypothetical protein
MAEQAPEKDGVYFDVPDSTYHGWQDAVSQSTLKVVRAMTPLHARQKLINPHDQTAAQSFGTALHLAMLEPDSFDDKVAEGLGIDRRSNANKAKHAEFEEANFGKLILKKQEFEDCCLAAESSKKHGIVTELMGLKGKEISVVWTDPDTGTRCKARYDFMGQYIKWNVIGDLKSTAADLSDRSLMREIGNWGYDIQAAFYLDGASVLAPADRRFLFVFAEKKAPFDMRVIEPNATALFEGRFKYRKALNTWAKCVKSGVYPGFEQKIQPLGLMPWDEVAERESDEEAI